MIRRLLAVAALLAGGVVWPAASVAAAPSCGLQSMGLSPSAKVTSEGVHLTMWTGKVASWDGIPLDVDVTLPAGCALPLVVFGHGWSNSKTDWESATAVRSDDPNKSDWNNVSFAARGDVSLNFSMRGWHGSCGPDASPTTSPAGLPAACTAGGRQYWIHLDDLRYEIRDAQWLVGLLVDTGAVDAGRIIATGGSYGGGQTDLLALLNDRVMCGGAAAVVPDPCAGRADGALVPWRSPHGVPLHVAGAVAEYTWASLVNALTPNGRASGAGSIDQRAFVTPVGIPIESYIDGLYADAYTPPVLENGFLQPPTSTDDTANLPLWFAAIQAGLNTVASSAPGTSAITSHALTELADFKSPLTPLVQPDGAVPLLQIQGLTDPLFRPVEALMLRSRLLAYRPTYPVASEFGDVGHSYAANPPDDWARFNADANAFVAAVLAGRPTASTVTAIDTRCRTALHQPLVVHQAASWAALAHGALDLSAATGGVTTNASEGVLGPRTDPIANGGAPVAGFQGGCPLVSPAVSDPGTVMWTWPVRSPVTLLGSPRVHVALTMTGPDAELNGRLWDLAPDGSEALMARGTYRLAGTTGPVTFELSANAWQLPAGHSIRLELTGADSPYFQLDAIPSAVSIASVGLSLPTAESGVVAGVPPVGSASPVAGAGGGGGPGLPATGGPGWVAAAGLVLLAAGVCAGGARRRVRRVRRP